MNLCVNPRDAMPNGGSLVITRADSDDQHPLAVRPKDLPPGKHVRIAESATDNHTSPG
jgi:hypothetical protein